MPSTVSHFLGKLNQPLFFALYCCGLPGEAVCTMPTLFLAICLHEIPCWLSGAETKGVFMWSPRFCKASKVGPFALSGDAIGLDIHKLLSLSILFSQFLKEIE